MYLEYLLINYFGKSKCLNNNKLFNLDFFVGVNGRNLSNTITNQLTKEFPTFKHLGDFNKRLKKIYLKELKNAKCEIQLKNQTDIEKLYSQKITPTLFSKLNNYLFDKLLTTE